MTNTRAPKVRMEVMCAVTFPVTTVEDFQRLLGTWDLHVQGSLNIATAISDGMSRKVFARSDVVVVEAITECAPPEDIYRQLREIKLRPCGLCEALRFFIERHFGQRFGRPMVCLAGATLGPAGDTIVPLVSFSRPNRLLMTSFSLDELDDETDPAVLHGSTGHLAILASRDSTPPN